jgi:(E)-4-hydroxy-3-methyl-but-2-enyl pyrophosphate reductase
MNVIRATAGGFCWGVRRAVDKVTQLAAEADGAPIYTDGPLIHNNQMIEDLEQCGVKATDTPEAANGQTLVVRAHGISPERRAYLKKLPLRLQDATCPDVAKIHAAIKKHVSQGYEIIIYGDEGHAEVTGLAGYAGDHGHIVGNLAEVDSLPAMEKVAVVSQTTQFPPHYAELADAIKARYPDAKILDTICTSTKNRLMELAELATRVDAFVVVGGAHSANTVRLFEVAAELKPTHHIQTASQLDPTWFTNLHTIGLTAGASTPDFIIDEVQAALEQISSY